MTGGSRPFGRCRCHDALAGFRCFHVGRDDAPMRPGALDAGEVDAGILGQAAAPAARQRRGLHETFELLHLALSAPISPRRGEAKNSERVARHCVRPLPVGEKLD